MTGIARRTTALCLALPALALCSAPAVAKLAYTTFDGSTSAVWVARDDGRLPRRLVEAHAPEGVSRASISPDGRLVAYELVGVEPSRLMVVPAAGGPSRVLATDVFFCAWSPGSRLIAAIAFGTIGHAHVRSLVALDVAGGAMRTLRPMTSGFYDEVRFSPHGSALVYEYESATPGGVDGANASDSSPPPSTNIYTVSIAGGRPRRLTRDQRSTDPVWGSRWIAFTSWDRRYRKDAIYVVKPSGARLHRLTAPRADLISAVAWSADGRRMLANVMPSGYGGFGPDPTFAVTVSAHDGSVRPVGRQSGRRRPIVGVALSRDGGQILGTRDVPVRPFETTTDIVSLPYRGGGLRLLARRATSPTWTR